MDRPTCSASTGVLLGGLSTDRMAWHGTASQCRAQQRTAKQHGLLILRLISPGRFDPWAWHLNATQCMVAHRMAKQIG